MTSDKYLLNKKGTEVIFKEPIEKAGWEHKDYETKTAMIIDLNNYFKNINEICNSTDHQWCINEHAVGAPGRWEKEAQNNQNIMLNGCYLDRYPSIYSTMTYMGNLYDRDIATKVVNYIYPSSGNLGLNNVFLLPKTIEIYGQQVPFAESLFELTGTYKENNTEESIYSCPFDYLKKVMRLISLPAEFNLASLQVLDNAYENRYQAFFNSNHIAQKSKEEQDAFFKPYKDKMIKEFNLEPEMSSEEITNSIKTQLKKFEKENYADTKDDFTVYHKGFDFD